MRGDLYLADIRAILERQGSALDLREIDVMVRARGLDAQWAEVLGAA